MTATKDPKILVERKKKHDALKRQVGGSHYMDWPIQPIKFIVDNRISYIEGCIIKYAIRHRNKGGKEDLEKIKHYVDLLIELEYGEDENK